MHSDFTKALNSWYVEVGPHCMTLQLKDCKVPKTRLEAEALGLLSSMKQLEF